MLNVVESQTGHPVGKIIAVHLNYRSRCDERGRTPSEACYFMKPTSSLAASAEVERPEGFELLDYFIYANAAALIFGPHFFKAVPESMQLILGFATVGISFLFRPFGAAVAGHYGDRLGRKAMLVLTLMLMGGATTLIGLLPTANAIGIWAPILLIVLRIVQGFSAAGEWGGAALMAVEHTPSEKRGRFGAFPQIGGPVGMLMSTGFLAMLSVLLTEQQFQAWGWRVPFLFSVVLIGIGMWIRMGATESPVFQELTEHPRRGEYAARPGLQAQLQGGAAERR